MIKHSRIGTIHILVSLLYIFSSTHLIGQTIDRHVISTAGENFQTANGSLLFTTGEIAVEIFKRDIQLSQGFHQEWAVITSIASASAETLDVRVYPNPTIGILNIESESEVQVFLYDLSGKLKLTSLQASGPAQIDLSYLPASIYVIEVSDKTGRKKVLKIEKVE